MDDVGDGCVQVGTDTGDIIVMDDVGDGCVQVGTDTGDIIVMDDVGDGCVQVGTDFLEEEITKFEDLVQSVDIAAFNKI